MINADWCLARSSILPESKIKRARCCDSAPFQFAKRTCINPAELRNEIDIERSSEPVRNGVPTMIGLAGAQRESSHPR